MVVIMIAKESAVVVLVDIVNKMGDGAGRYPTHVLSSDEYIVDLELLLYGDKRP